MRKGNTEDLLNNRVGTPGHGGAGKIDEGITLSVGHSCDIAENSDRNGAAAVGGAPTFGVPRDYCVTEKNGHNDAWESVGDCDSVNTDVTNPGLCCESAGGVRASGESVSDGEWKGAMPVTYEMNLNPEPFEAIRSGRKNVEMRLNDERRQPIKRGDYIRFTHTESGETMLVRVLDKLAYVDFAELYAHHDKTTIGYTADDVADPDDMLKYYTAEKIRKYGALALVVELL